MAALVFDLDGVLYVDGVGVPGVSEALAELAAAGHRLVFATNNATRSRAQVAEAITRATDYEAAPESVVTSSMAAAALLQGEVDRAYVVGEPGLAATLADSGIVAVGPADAQAVVVGLDRDLTYDKLRDATMAIRKGARFIATNRDETYPTASGLWPGGGAIVAALEAAAGRRAELAGKPAEPMRLLLRNIINSDEVWMIGDRPDTDLAMGVAEGWHTVLVLSGVTADPEGVEPAPSVVINSVADLPRVL